MHSKQHFDCKCTVLEAIPPEKQYLSSPCLALLGAGSSLSWLAGSGEVVGWKSKEPTAAGMALGAGRERGRQGWRWLMGWRRCWAGLQPVVGEKGFEMLLGRG